jgi:hypothetical protein
MKMALTVCVLAGSALIAAACNAMMTPPGFPPAETSQQQSRGRTMTQHPYVGMWVTADGHIRQELLANGRYDEARGSRQSAYQGRYEVRGTHIDYWDDTGFTADGTFVNEDELHHGGMIFYREKA